ncbi:DoxX family protein [Jiangella asiatica]|uniref:DoxX family protein n=1 Tax=Jiangella asiatica TaxID=2530372 RepID=A0A4R5DCM7_9ACTN|nr:DoxX family protein [Jiangella asiatica]TDE11469.1 DoxX family protein [Jiangella asiatica]
MFVATVICSVLLALAFAGTGVGKASGKADIVDGLGRLGVSPPLVRVIGLLELGGAAGVAVGLAVAWLGIAAAIGLAALMIGAITTHLRAGDYGEPTRRGGALMPVALLLLAVATLVLRAATS